MNNVIPLRPDQVTITKRQYRQACNAYINSVNLTQQLLMVHRGASDLSDAAIYQLEDGLRLIIQQLKEIVDGENDLPAS